MIALDQANLGEVEDATAGATATLTTAQAAAAGSTIIVVVSWVSLGDARSFVGVSGGGLTWQTDHASPSDIAGIAVASARAPAGLASSTALTLTFSGAVDEVAGAASSFAGITATSRETGTSADEQGVEDGTWSAPAITPGVAHALVIGAAMQAGNGNPTSTPDAGWSELHDLNLAGVGQHSLTMVSRIVSAIAAYTPSGVWSGATAGDPQVRAAVAYKAVTLGDLGLGVDVYTAAEMDALLAALGGAGDALIETQVLGAAGLIDFQNIPDDYAHLRVIVEGRAANAAQYASCFLRFNANADTQYNYQFHYSEGGSGGAGNGFEAAGLVGYVPAADATAAMRGLLEVYVPNYASAAGQMAWNALSVGQLGSAGMNGIEVFGEHEVLTAAITRLQIGQGTGMGNMAAGTMASLYGLAR